MSNFSRRHFVRDMASMSLAISAGFLSPAMAAEPDAQQLLKSSDQARGGGLPGLIWEVETHNTGSGADEQVDQKLRVKAIETSSLAEVIDPPNSKGAKILQVDRNMWISKPGLKKPVAISPRQRLTGQVAIGDIAATNYVRDYTARYLREEPIDNEACHVLELSSANKQTTYDRITYWVSVKRGVAVQAEFLSLSGKKLKSARFEYGNTIQAGGKSIAFVSKMNIADALTDARTVMQFGKVRVQGIPASEFDVGNMQ